MGAMMTMLERLELWLAGEASRSRDHNLMCSERSLSGSGIIPHVRTPMEMLPLEELWTTCCVLDRRARTLVVETVVAHVHWYWTHLDTDWYCELGNWLWKVPLPRCLHQGHSCKILD